jgi:hypothetical protein
VDVVLALDDDPLAALDELADDYGPVSDIARDAVRLRNNIASKTSAFAYVRISLSAEELPVGAVHIWGPRQRMGQYLHRL